MPLGNESPDREQLHNELSNYIYELFLEVCGCNSRCVKSLSLVCLWPGVDRSLCGADSKTQPRI